MRGRHFLLHGLNVSVAMGGGGGGGEGAALVGTAHFRLYWLCLNVAYVCEFFMQTLVKRGAKRDAAERRWRGIRAATDTPLSSFPQLVPNCRLAALPAPLACRLHEPAVDAGAAADADARQHGRGAAGETPPRRIRDAAETQPTR